jgi:MFS family permease
MYSESDIEAAVASGALTPEAAAALRQSVAAGRSAPAVDEESFRLITGFNDIFVSIASILLLVAVGWIGANLAGGFEGVPGNDTAAMRFLASRFLIGAAAVAAASWMLAEYFTRRRRMALPSILLLGTFVAAVGVSANGLAQFAFGPAIDPRANATIAAFAGFAAAIGAYAHWRRFHVPITIAALTGAVVITIIALLFVAVPAAAEAWRWLLLIAGVGVFGFAMWWDMSDRSRITRRSDVAFWLHLFAAPMIAHPIFGLLGVMNGQIGPATAAVVVILYILFGVIALAVDRRALLVSSLVYVLYALSALFDQFGAVSLNIALTALVIGSALLMLSAFWHSIRRSVVQMLPADLQARLPELDRVVVARPA